MLPLTNRFSIVVIAVAVIILLPSCKPTKHQNVTKSIIHAAGQPAIAQAVHDTTFVNLKEYSSDFVYDMKYATEDNFMKAKVYFCGECYLRLKTVKALINANNDFIRKGYRIKIFDCYRPLDIQKKIWLLVRDPKYVADPSKGSIHNRGGAVDITLVDQNGTALPMGTDFDFFGPEAAHGNIDHPSNVLKNRKMLRKIMRRNKFNAFESEWWHYNLQDAKKDNLSNFRWDCD